MVRFPLALALLLTACGPSADDDDSAAADDDDTTPEPTEGRLLVSFRIDEDWFNAMDEPAIGSFRATIFDSDDVTGAGPADDAREYGDLFVEGVDLTDGDFTTAVLATTDPLPPTWVTILGFLDSDGNATDADPGPDDGDPVTLPNSNEFLVVVGEDTPAEVYFGFLQP